MKQVLALATLVLLVTVSCEQPTVDPDQKLRDTIVGRAWTPDPAFPADVVQPLFDFAVDGGAMVDKKPGYTWSYLNSVFTVTGPLGMYSTTSPAFDTSHFVFFYGPDAVTPQLVHLIR